MSSKYCNRCKQTKSLEEFHHNPESKDGHTSYCKVCRYDYQKKYKATDNGYKAHQRAYKKAYDSRTPKQIATHKQTTYRWHLKKKWDKACRLCRNDNGYKRTEEEWDDIMDLMTQIRRYERKLI